MSIGPLVASGSALQLVLTVLSELLLEPRVIIEQEVQVDHVVQGERGSVRPRAAILGRQGVLRWLVRGLGLDAGGEQHGHDPAVGGPGHLGAAAGAGEAVPTVVGFDAERELLGTQIQPVRSSGSSLGCSP